MTGTLGTRISSRRPAAADRGLRARGAASAGLERVRAHEHGHPPARRRRGGRRRGRHLRRRRPRDPAGRRPRRSRSPGAGRSPTFSEHLAALDLFPAPPTARGLRALPHAGRYESAALDLALRQAGTSPARACSGASRSRCASSSRCASASRRRSSRCAAASSSTRGCASSSTRRSSWDEELIAELVATGAVDVGRLQGLLLGLDRRPAARPGALRRVAEAFPDAWIEDPALTPETDAVLAAHRERFSWDAPIHSVADIERAALSAAHGQHQALAPRRPAQPARRASTTAPRTGSATTAAASSSSASAAARSSTSPRSSTPTRPTTSRRPASTCPSRRAGLPGSPLAPAPIGDRLPLGPEQ